MIPRAVVLALAAAFALGCGKSSSSSGPSFKNVVLPNLDGTKTVSLGSCPTERCLAVVVAPWCGYCRAATPLIRELRPFLKKNGMDSWVVVALDREANLKEYAKEFGSDTLIDSRKALDPGGVPHFYVVDKQGAIIRHTAGLPPDPRMLITWIVTGES